MLEDFCYAHFSSFGRSLLRVFKGIEDDMEAANMRLHPEVYLSMIGFITYLATAASVAFLILVLLDVIPFFLPFPFMLLLVMLPPLVTLLIGALIPKLIVSNKISGLKNEIPYASMYLSVMASGGLTPYASLLRLRDTELLPKLRNEIGRIERILLSTGMDPVSAMAKAAKALGLKEYKELLLGYASTLRTGGDILHYLYSQTESMFRRMALRIKTMGDHMAMLMEGYTIVAILGTLGVYMIFIVSLSFPQFQALPPEMFFTFSFALLPGISIAFLYFADTMQINYPISQWKAYLALAASAPAGIFMLSQTVLPEPALGMAVSLGTLCLPMVISDRYFSKADKGVLEGVTSFLRDLVENRKTGLSPERSIQLLANRDYGKFTKYLKLMSAEISWGIPGTEESLETLAEFAEQTRELEQERHSSLAPLFIVPYMGAAILTLTTILLLQLFTNMSVIGGTSGHSDGKDCFRKSLSGIQTRHNTYHGVHSRNFCGNPHSVLTRFNKDINAANDDSAWLPWQVSYNSEMRSNEVD